MRQVAHGSRHPPDPDHTCNAAGLLPRKKGGSPSRARLSSRGSRANDLGTVLSRARPNARNRRAALATSCSRAMLDRSAASKTWEE